MKGTSDNLGRTIMIAVIAGVLFAGFLALTPRLTAGSGSPEPVGPAAVESEVTPTTAIGVPVVAVPSAGFDGFDDQDESVTEVAPEPVVDPAEEPDPAWPDHQPADDGTLSLSVEVFGPAEGKESVVLQDFDEARFQIRLTNTSDQHLWGVFAYLEGYGEIDCIGGQLAAGEHMECSVYDTVYSGSDTAVVWANAWTSEHQVGVVTTYDYFVAP